MASLVDGTRQNAARGQDSRAAGRHPLATSGTEAPAQRPRREHLVQIDVLRIVAIVAVVATHITIFTQSSASVGAQGLTVLLHVSRFAFFFITAFVLYLTYGGRPMRVLPFWRKRFPPVLLPYLVWTLIYWQYNRFFPWGGYPDTLSASLWQLGTNLLNGWFQLYFLIVTFQLYIVFPLIAWIVRKTEGRHLLLLAVTGGIELLWLYAMQYQWPRLPGALQAVFGHAQAEIWSYQFFFFVGAVAAAHKDRLIDLLRRHRRSLAAAVPALLAIAFGLYALNLALGQSPLQAAGVFQPAIVPVFFGSLLGLGLLAQRLADTKAPTSLVWRLFVWAGEISFGIYLSHMLALQLLVLPQVQALGLDLLPAPVDGVVTWALTVLFTVLLVTVLRHLPFANALTGRPRRPFSTLRRA
ncbi:MAG: acyltransferase, partial [Candidatus Dormibacteraceae bacterium]